MEKKNLDAQSGTQELAAPILPEKTCWDEEYLAKPEPFSASKREFVLALCLYPVVYFCYLGDSSVWPFAVFCALFCAMTEAFYWKLPRSRESWFWLGCLMITAITGTFGKNRVWGELTVLFTHAFAVYWVLSRSGRLLEGESSHLLPLDALFGLIVFPFKHFFLRIRTIGYGLSQLKGGGKKQPAVYGLAALSLALTLGLLALAVRSLASADEAFAGATERVFSALRFEVDSLVLWRFAASLPVGAYLFGLIAGTGRESLEGVRARGEKVNAALGTLHKVPMVVWTAALGVFALVYAAFFVLQAGYLFGAFTRTVPEGYTVAEYARQGFFSLCRVMAINFALLWLVTRTGMLPVQAGSRHNRILCSVILLEGLLFAVIAASKLYLYIASYGFTPLRLQSAWLIAVLAFGCGCALYALWTRKKSFRIWIYFSAAALTLLCLY